MEYKIINTGDYLLIVDDSEIKEGEWYLNQTGNVIEKLTDRLPSSGQWCKKIIAHLPLNNSPILEGVALLPPIEDEVEKFVEHHLNTTYIVELDESIKSTVIDDYKAGYNKAKEKYKYTEEDLRKAIEVGVNAEAGDYPKGFSHKLVISLEDYFIQSLQQPKMPVGFECEIIDTSNMGVTLSYPLTKTTTNSQGLTQWVGEYIY